jgi:ankyrin repeat protein
MKALGSFLTAVFLMLPGPAALQAQDIFDAIRHGDMAKIKEFIEKGPQLVKAQNTRQSTPLHVAVDVDNEPIARYLIEKGADLNALNGNEWTPFMYVKTVGMARLLADRGADINAGLPIIWMTVNKRKDVAEYLLDKGARLPDIGTPPGLLLLVRSLRCGSGRFLDEYRKRGFDPLYQGPAKNNLLHFASESDSADLIDRLIGLGVPANQKNLFGRKPLHIAAANGNLQAIKSLLKKDPDINARTPDGKTAYNLAQEAKRAEVVDYLKSAGADQAPPRFPELRGDWMGQPEPGKKAVPFAPGILAPQHEYHGAITFSPDGNEMFWSAYTDDQGASLWRAGRENGRWHEPEFFSRGDVPFISPDGSQLFFVAFKAVPGGTKEVIYFRDRTASGWSEPKELPDIINSLPRIHWQASVDKWGNLYFGASGEKGSRIHLSEFKGGEYSRPQVISSLKDTEAFSPYIAPHGSYLIITKVGDTGEELAILFKKRDGTWTPGIELSSRLGITGAFCPIVTHDGQHLFFVSCIEGAYAPFWVDASFIEDLRQEALKDDK